MPRVKNFIASSADAIKKPPFSLENDGLHAKNFCMILFVGILGC